MTLRVVIEFQGFPFEETIKEILSFFVFIAVCHFLAKCLLIYISKYIPEEHIVGYRTHSAMHNELRGNASMIGTR